MPTAKLAAVGQGASWGAYLVHTMPSWAVLQPGTHPGRIRMSCREGLARDVGKGRAPGSQRSRKTGWGTQPGENNVPGKGVVTTNAMKETAGCVQGLWREGQRGLHCPGWLRGSGCRQQREREGSARVGALRRQRMPALNPRRGLHLSRNFTEHPLHRAPRLGWHVCPPGAEFWGGTDNKLKNSLEMPVCVLVPPVVGGSQD